MKGALPSQRDGGWQWAQLGQCLWQGAGGVRGQLEANLAPGVGTARLDRPRNQPRASS